MNLLNMFATTAASSRLARPSPLRSRSPPKQTPDDAPIWAYRYNVQDEGNLAAGLGVPHIFEAAAIFGPRNVPGAAPSYFGVNAPIIPQVQDRWLNFVRFLDPNGAASADHLRSPLEPKWEVWRPAAEGIGNISSSMRRLVFETGNITMEDTDQERYRCSYWSYLGYRLNQ